jgi:hypothetical protein
MPLYEYTCLETGETIELIRPMADADKPLTEDEISMALGAQTAPRKKYRFVRRLSTFQAKSDAGRRVPLPTPGMGGGCGCGNPNGPCNI